MRRILIAAVLVGALAQAGAASAGCMATVGLAPPPAGIAPGTTWVAEVTVLQHGVNALPNASTARPTLTIVNSETGARKTFAAQGTKNPEVFVADVVFPTAGSWRYEVYDDFSSWGGEPAPCAQTHSFAAVTVGGPAGGGTPSGPNPAETVATAASTGDGFPVWPVVAGALAALALAAALVLLRRRPSAPPGDARPASAPRSHGA
jgi:LPXTG-motif cell wall-anchored protein